jgi:hypothetical protein
MEAWILGQEIERSRAFIVESEELDQEVDCLSAQFVEHLHEKRNREFKIQLFRLFRGEIEKGKNILRVCLWGRLQGNLQASREMDAAKARRDAESQLKCNTEPDSSLMMVYLGEV